MHAQGKAETDMGAIGECLGSYGSKQGQCDSCPLALLCIDTAIAIDAYYDQQASWIEDAEEIENERLEHG